MAYITPDYRWLFMPPRCRARTSRCYADCPSTYYTYLEERSDTDDTCKVQRTYERIFWKALDLFSGRRRDKAMRVRKMPKTKVY
jgi:hypothetical protein